MQFASGAVRIEVSGDPLDVDWHSCVKRAWVEFQGDDRHTVHYLRRPFHREPDFGVTSVNYDFKELIARAGPPS